MQIAFKDHTIEPADTIISWWPLPKKQEGRLLSLEAEAETLNEPF